MSNINQSDNNHENKVLRVRTDMIPVNMVNSTAQQQQSCWLEYDYSTPSSLIWICISFTIDYQYRA